MAIGKVWLVGAGPGDPGLLTVRGRELLEGADVVLYDALSHPALLEHCPSTAELRNVGKLGGQENPSQTWITDQLVELARAGRQVVRLKGGDSYLFARGAEEVEELVTHGIPFEVVPGLCSPVGTSAYAGIPLTHRDLSSSVTFITGHDKAGKEWSDVAWKKLATATDTLCILMGMRRLPQIAEAIIGGGRSPNTPVAIVQWGARPRQRVLVTTLKDAAQDVKQSGLKNPAVIVIGEVVSLRETLSWYERQPLFGRHILVPRPPHQAGATAKAIRERGAEPVLFPVIEITQPPEAEPLRAAVGELNKYDWLLFTSANGVHRFFDEVERQGLDARALGKNRIGVIGPKTGQALSAYGVRSDLQAKEFVGEGLAKALIEQGPVGRVLIPRALVAREQLPEALRAAGMTVDVVAAYQTNTIAGERAAQFAEALRSGSVDTIIFTSSSTVSATVEALGADAVAVLGHVTVASIGPVTSATAKKLGITVDVMAAEYTVSGLLDALAKKAI